MDVDKGKLRLSIKSLNNCGLAKFQVDLKQPMETLISDFMSAVETVSVDKENELPDAVADMYNLLADNKTMEGGFDIADAALAARQKKEEIDMGKKVEKKETKKVEPKKENTKPAKVTKPVKEMVTKEKPVKEKKPKAIKATDGEMTAPLIREGTKSQKAVDFVKANPGTSMYTLRQCDWNDKNDSYYNLFNKLIKDGKMRKDEKGYYVI